jgi:IS5 family transposase
MSNQISFSEVEYRVKRKKTQKEKFLEKMRSIVPLERWCEIIRPFYYENGNGRQPISLAVMLRMYLVSLWYNLSDEAAEDLIIESLSVRNYVGITGDAPDSTTLCKFRHILENNNLTKIIFDELTALLQEKKILFKEGTIVDATIIEAPDSTKNKDKKSNPEMRSTKKGNNNYFGLKAHIGVDKDSGLVHGVAVTTANVSDVEMANEVLHGDEKEVRGDAGFIGLEKREEICEIYKDGTGRKEKQKPSHGKKRADTFVKKSGVSFIVNKKRSQVITEEDKAEEKAKSQVRAKVEHAFCIVKHLFGFRKARYRTLTKSTHQLLMLFALANLYRCVMRKICLK